jgi:hypothetical protein
LPPFQNVFIFLENYQNDDSSLKTNFNQKNKKMAFHVDLRQQSQKSVVKLHHQSQKIKVNPKQWKFQTAWRHDLN